ncbi:dCTP deaminase [Halovenus marina]|uniref:dCTP deaminase n=1 Tax=Halovenus marina TaxID=3396621 RepID=UPI003F5505F5
MVDYTAFVEDIVHEPTQTEGRGLDLTVAEVYEVTDPGRVDFGGGELEPAATDPHPTEKRNPDDDYEWWHLEPGQYLIEYNESLRDGDLCFQLQTRDELLVRGAFHPTLDVTELPPVPLSVSDGGLLLKENARVSTLVDAKRE